MTRLAFDLDGWDVQRLPRRRAADRGGDRSSTRTRSRTPGCGTTGRSATRSTSSRPSASTTTSPTSTPTATSSATTVRQVMLSVRELALDKNPNADGLGQPADRLHPRHRRRDGPGQRGRAARASRTSIIPNLPPVSTRRRARDHPAPDLLRRAAQPATSSSARSRPSSTTRAGSDRRRRGRRHDDAGPARPGSSSTRPSSRLLFALRFRDLNLLISDQITTDSQLLFHRSLDDRLPRIAPFLRYDKDPYLVVDGSGQADLHPGRLHDERPLPERPGVRPRRPGPRPASAAATFNYIRNSVKIVMDAYDGTMTFYVATPTTRSSGPGRASSRRCSSR